MVDLTDYLPFKLVNRHEDWLVQWVDMQGHVLKSGVMQDDFDAEIQARASQQLTTLDVLDGFPSAEPRAFIVHHSRCGSSLMVHLLAAVCRWTALSEPTVINSLLMTHMPVIRKKQVLRGIVSALISRSVACTRPAVIKLSSWNLLYLDLIREVFPDVPFIYVFRDPRRSLLSLIERPNWIGRPDLPDWLSRTELGNQLLDAGHQQERVGILLSAWLKMGLPQGDWSPHLIHFPDIPEQVKKLYLTMTNSPWTDETEKFFQQQLAYDAHKPGSVFDKSRLEADIPASIQDTHDNYTRDIYDRLLRLIDIDCL